MSSSSRVWFITGSSQGLGKALLDEVLASGERAVATLRNPKALEHLSTQFPASQLLILHLDVTKPAEIIKAFEDAKVHFGRIDVVVNNAGYGLSSEIETTPDEEARKSMEVLFWGPVNICKEAIKFMRDVNPPGQGGRILNISSAGGYNANPGLAFYHAGKFALEGFTEALAKETLPEWNIKSTIIEPGGFRTEWASSSMIRLPTLAYYTSDTSPSELMRRTRDPNKFIGDPAKAAKAIIRIAGEKDVPIRVQLGTDSLLLVRNKARRTIRDGEAWEGLAHSTNADGVDKEKVLEVFKQADK